MLDVKGCDFMQIVKGAVQWAECSMLDVKGDSVMCVNVKGDFM